MIDYIEKLRKHGKKTITKTELETLFSTFHEETLFHIIRPLIEEHILTPPKNAKTNGNLKYPIHLKYNVTLPAITYDKELSEIASLHPLLQKNEYLQKKPVEYINHCVDIQKLDHYLFLQSHTNSKIPISRKERSFEIFGDEKKLDNRSFCSFLEKLGLNKETLFFYDTPEYCFHDFIPEKKQKMTLLICENKDIWFNIRRKMFEDNATTIFETHIDGVICGWGNKVSEKNALTSYTNFMGGAEVTYLYWGDIDRAGLNIYFSLVKNNPNLTIKLFIPAYEKMLQLSQIRLSQNKEIPDSDDKREIMDDYSEIFNAVQTQYKTFLKENIENNKRIPQEIISYAFLKDNMK